MSIPSSLASANNSNNNNNTPPPPSSSTQPKKRTRVTPSQLSVLEETFAISATPDSKMRKQLAQQLQMPERSIQIWFQNRRAKVKMLQKRALLREEQEAAKARLYAQAAAQPYWYYRPQKLPIQRAWSIDNTTTSSLLHQQQQQPIIHPPPLVPFVYPSDTVRATSTSSSSLAGPPHPSLLDDSAKSNDLYHHQDTPETSSQIQDPLTDPRFRRIDSEPVPFAHEPSSLFDSMTPDLVPAPSGIINASALTIGTWHRMKITQQDLLCYYHLTDRAFAWHIRDSDYHFKMMFSFDTVASIRLCPMEDNVSAELQMDLTEPPLFFMENRNSPEQWIQCSDFTEGMQATCILRHSIRGLLADLKQELLRMASADDGLSQTIRFSDFAASQNNLLMPWRHQSLPLGATDFNTPWPSQQVLPF